MAGRKSSMGFNLSPKKRRSVAQVAQLDQSMDNVFIDVPENNDEAERRERQLNRLQQLQQRNLSSPSTVNDKQKNISGVSGLTNQQLSDHYAKCIQLSAENKISMKNAFNLQLIDYMAEMLSRESDDMKNFQVASCTLDASTKIYAYRVDSVHTDTLKVAGGLGRTKKEMAMEGSEGAEGEIVVEGGKRRKRIKRGATVATNEQSLNVANYDLEFETDLLFKKRATQFDEGRSGGGQFLSSLPILDDSGHIILDSDTVLCMEALGSKETNTAKVVFPVCPELSEKLVCPTFAPFEFTTWKIEDEDTFLDIDKDEAKEQQNDYAFNVDTAANHMDDEPYFEAEDGFGLEDVAGDDENGTVVTVGQEGCHKEAKAPPPKMETVYLKEHLANVPLEYSYFDTRVMSAWAGPGHWRLKAITKDKNKDAEADGKKEKKKKDDLQMNFEVDPEIEKYFAITRKATKITRLTLKKWTKERTTLPADLHYDATELKKLYVRPSIVIRRQVKEPPTVDDSIRGYDYDNNNDTENYCPDMDDDNDNTCGYDMTDIFSQTVRGPLQEIGKPGEDFLGDNLVAAPNKVAKLNIGYARTAKKIDMKRLKMSIWSLLTDSSTNKENENSAENKVQPQSTADMFQLKEKMDDNMELNFSKIYKDLPSKLSSKMSENLSVPLAFIALLHLTNERSLKLMSSPDLTDFRIGQD
ncbi:non-SMC condensin I complex subunit H [Oratosquilla oratoria]|uniref:non-SMC condensin I complex subunit H n=1 Tax=Oratosquilla oratoria TaxID=337810 RepID=UPI003F75CDE5